MNQFCHLPITYVGNLCDAAGFVDRLHLENQFSNKQITSKCFLFVSYVWETGTALTIESLNTILSEIQNRYPAINTILLLNSWFKYENYQFTNVRVVYIDYFLYRTYSEIHLYKKSSVNSLWSSNTDKFLFLTGKPDKIHRIRLLYKFYKNNLLGNCIWSLFRSQTSTLQELLPELTQNQLEEFLMEYQRNPDNIQTRSESNIHYGGIPYDTMLFDKTSFRVISETTINNAKNPWITEKTWITILNSCPFIMAGDPTSLLKLKSMGFNTFEQYLIIKDYDNIVDSENRLDAIVQNTTHWLSDIKNYTVDIQKDLDHNKNKFYDIANANWQLLADLIEEVGISAQPTDILPTCETKFRGHTEWFFNANLFLLGLNY